jgi:hypothetical protein
MAIETARLSNVSTVSKEKSLPSILVMYEEGKSPIDGNSSSVYFDAQQDKWVKAATPPPGLEGRMIAVVSAEFVCSIYVVVNGAWVPVRLFSTAINPDTGKPWSPLQNF